MYSVVLAVRVEIPFTCCPNTTSHLTNCSHPAYSFSAEQAALPAVLCCDQQLVNPSTSLAHVRADESGSCPCDSDTRGRRAIIFQATSVVQNADEETKSPS